jgi:GNAT superfamily N-acetyltransferase
VATGPRPYQLRPATAEDLGPLSELALRSKGHWGYDDAFLEACRDELTLTPGRLEAEVVTVAEVPGAGPVGFAALRLGVGVGEPVAPDGELTDLFVDPTWIGHGVGLGLWDDAVARARAAGCRALVIEADPFAEAWYARRGAVTVGRVPSGSIPGRSLPLMRLAL